MTFPPLLASSSAPLRSVPSGAVNAAQSARGCHFERPQSLLSGGPQGDPIPSGTRTPGRPVAADVARGRRYHRPSQCCSRDRRPERLASREAPCAGHRRAATRRHARRSRGGQTQPRDHGDRLQDADRLQAWSADPVDPSLASPERPFDAMGRSPAGACFPDAPATAAGGVDTAAFYCSVS
jgi:hypothetical protein